MCTKGGLSELNKTLEHEYARNYQLWRQSASPVVVAKICMKPWIRYPGYFLTYPLLKLFHYCLSL